MDAQKAAEKHFKLQDPAWASLEAYREKIMERRPGKVVPHFDPEDGGPRAQLLLLLTHVDGDPGAARNGSDFISTDNQDQSARNLRSVIEGIGLKSSAYVIWNVVPWQSTEPGKEAGSGAVFLPELLDLLKDLNGVALMSMDSKIRKVVEQEIGRIITARKLTLRYMSNPGQQSFVTHKEDLTRRLQSLAKDLSLIR